MVGLEQAMEEALKNDRVCPQPHKWDELYKLLPNKVIKGNGWEPSLPLILSAWPNTPYILKMFRLQEHIEWAYEHGCLDVIHEFMKKLGEEEWFHIGE